MAKYEEKKFLEGGKSEGPNGTGENQRSTLLIYGPNRESNQGPYYWRQALYALATHAILEIDLPRWTNLLQTNRTAKSLLTQQSPSA